jgi:hypothetical protein
MNDYVDFGDVARDMLNEQCQYISEYVDGRHGRPALGDGLRIVGDPCDYHGLKIHKDDVEEFVSRVTAYLANRWK